MWYHVNRMGLFISQVTITFLISWLFRPCNNMSVKSEFPVESTGNCSVANIKRLTHLAIDQVTSRIYVGGVNRLAQLNSALSVEQCVVTGPQDDSYLCHARGCDTPDIPIVPTDNVNKILVIDAKGRSLIACGSVLQGACHKYILSNISKGGEFFPRGIAANDENSSTYAFIGPENYYNNWEPSNVLYVGTTFTNNGEYRHDVPAISSRDLKNLDIAELSFSKQSLLRIDVKYRDQFLVNYIYGFNSTDYAYFVIVQKQSHLAGQEELGYVTRLARLCINDANYDSYTEITIHCSTSKKNYNLVQDAKLSRAGEELAAALGIDPGDPILTAAFSPSKTLTNEPIESSALCIYSIADIEAKFNENIHMCFNGSIKYRNMPYISGLILDGNCPEAGTTGNILNFCEVGLKISGIAPIKTSPAIIYDSVLITSVTVSMAERHTVIFLGTSQGFIKKILLLGPNSGLEYKQIEINPGQKILPDTAVSPSGDYLIVLSPNKIFKVPIEDCGSYSNCSSCLDAKDPYCGWCSLERKCTVRGACQKASQSAPRWLSYGTGQQCIDFEQILPDRIPITQMTTVSLTIRTLPELPSGTKYRCVFGGSKPVDAGLTETGLSCATPPLSSRPKIPTGYDHIYVALSVRSSETNKDFVSRNFAYYDCSVHTRCTDCVTSQWACNWCVYENKCTHNTTNCQRTVISGENNPATQIGSHGVNACPRFSKSSKELLLPNRVTKEITLEVENMPSPQVGHSGFQCIVTIEGAKMMVPARMEHQKILCDKTMYTYEANTGEYTAEVSLVWNRNHHVDSMSLILYKCDILGSHRDHPDCSLCVTRQAKYNCAWCSSTCDYAHSCKHYPTTECPKPRIDMIKPLSGPLEGGTLVIIEGSNLGLKEEDVLGKIHVGNTPCNLVEYDVSVRIVCRTEATKEEKVAMVVVGNQAGFTESAVHFSYKNVKVQSVWPTSGPCSGGTQLSISGHHLNIGTKTQVFLDDLPCTVNASQTSSSRLMCVTSASIAGPKHVKRLTLIIDGANRTLGPSSYVYKPDPTVLEIKPLKSPVSGGRMITVHGTNLNTIQKPQMIVYSDSSIAYINKSSCTVLNSAQMECPSPAVNLEFNREPSRNRRSLPGKVADKQSKLTLRIGFIMDGVQAVRDLDKHYKNLRSHIIYVEDPIYFQFPNQIKLYKGDTLVIEGEKLNYASDESDVNVTIGTGGCNVTSLAYSQLVCSPPQHQPLPTDEKAIETNIGLPLVVVRIGENLRFPIGYLRYDMVHAYTLPPEAMAGIAAGVACLIFLFIIVLIVYRRKSTQAEREYKRIQIQMDTLESNVRSECKQAFAELQTDMTDLTADLESSGIPTLDHNEYIMKVFFPGVRDHPILHNPKVRITGPTTNYDAAMLQFQQLINNKFFILTFIETLEEQESFSIRDKVNVASLIMVVLIDKMEYATEILRHLLIRLIDKSVGTKHPQLMLRRTESVVEKMLTNWMALSMYRYVKEYAGTPLFLLYKAIKHQIEKGPVDAITHDARYSLSEERLLREQIPHSVVTVHVVQDDVDEKIQCKVLDCDTISQVKLKILDALYKNTQFSLRPSIHDVDLEWRHGRGGHLTLQDEDLTSKSICGWKRLNTLHHYGVKDSAVMSLISRNSGSFNGLCNQPLHNCTSDYIDGHRVYGSSGVALNTTLGIRETHDTNSSTRVYHLVRPVDDRHGLVQERSHNAIPEIFLTRLLSTKGTIQKFVDDLFMTVLTVNSELPLQVKWLFDLFDDHARRHSISDSEVVHAWKSNSLPLRFWVNFIKNPDYMFDINKTTTVDSCLSVIAQTFMDSCSTSDHRLGKDSPSNKLLFAKDIPHYREMVARFYADVANSSPVTDKELSAAMHELSTAQKGYFHIISALKELYIYVTKYSDQIYESLETDTMCKKLNLSIKLETVARILEGDRSPPC
ncbi:plexin B isoform X2 [Rhodnius prolixus]|uniref:plexin B isoform X2 n=1 Tax=Rhodnius prolixus TaxID=13249 RepID=UPI003D187AB9